MGVKQEKPTTRAGRPPPKPRSVPTGLYFLCPASRILHDLVYAVPIYQGPKCYFAKCPACMGMVFFGHAWKDNMGLTREGALHMGATLSG